MDAGLEVCTEFVHATLFSCFTSSNEEYTLGCGVAPALSDPNGTDTWARVQSNKLPCLESVVSCPGRKSLAIQLAALHTALQRPWLVWPNRKSQC
jgi:hypothetical protein